MAQNPQRRRDLTPDRPAHADARDRHTLYSVTGRMGAWPSVLFSREELVAVFSGDRIRHVDPFGKTLLVRSTDQGETWSQPVVIQNGPLDDRDPGLVETPDGTWVLSWFTSVAFTHWREQARKHYGDAEVDGWRPWLDRVTPALKATALGSFVRRSTDRGRTWSEPVRIPVSAPHGPVVAPGGALLYLGNRLYDGPPGVGVARSDDGGATWHEIGSVAPAEGVHLCEPHLAVLPDGTLVGLFRANADREDDRHLYRAESTDGGRTWSQPIRTPLWGLPPHLLVHSSGVLVCTYGHRRRPFGQRAALSLDRGLTWSPVLTLAEVDHDAWRRAVDVGPGHRPGARLYYQEPDLGYPATAELPDGSLYTVYYESFPDRIGAAVHGVRWELPRHLDPVGSRGRDRAPRQGIPR